MSSSGTQPPAAGGKAAALEGTPFISLFAPDEARSSLARYPDPASNALRDALGVAYGLEADRIVCGTGSDELLSAKKWGAGPTGVVRAPP